MVSANDAAECSATSAVLKVPSMAMPELPPVQAVLMPRVLMAVLVLMPVCRYRGQRHTQPQVVRV
jgi:hypothetical protein